MQARILDFTASEESGRTYHFEGQSLPTGEVVIPSAQTNDEWYESLDAVEAHGTDTLEGSQETGETQEWSAEDLAKSITGAAREFGVDAVPESLRRHIEF